jgi:hypothetical protein
MPVARIVPRPKGVDPQASALSRSDSLDFFQCYFLKNEIYVPLLPVSLNKWKTRTRIAKSGQSIAKCLAPNSNIVLICVLNCTGNGRNISWLLFTMSFSGRTLLHGVTPPRTYTKNRGCKITRSSTRPHFPQHKSRKLLVISVTSGTRVRAMSDRQHVPLIQILQVTQKTGKFVPAHSIKAYCKEEVNINSTALGTTCT